MATVAATRLQLLTIFILTCSFCISRTIATVSTADVSVSSSSSTIISPSVPPSPSTQMQQDSTMTNPSSLLEPILTNLGFQELAMAVPSLSSDSTYTTWNGPSTLFAPTDSSIRSCGSSCSIPQLLREHMVPGIFSSDYLRKLSFGTKLETMSPGRCITVTSAINTNRTIVFIGGVEITHPDLFYNGLVVVHRLEGFISPLSPFSCNIERISSSSLPYPPISTDRYHAPPSPAIMRLMLRDAMLRLHNNGFSVLALALRVKYPEIVNLQNMTVFALDDASIFAGGHSYLSNFRFHIVPNRLLMNADLMKLNAGVVLPTMERGETLMVTTPAGGNQVMRINYVRVKVPDVMHNLKIAVHSVFLPFPHLHPTMEFAAGAGLGGIGFDANAAAANAGTGLGAINEGVFPARDDAMGSCDASAAENKPGSCAVTTPPLPAPEIKSTML